MFLATTSVLFDVERTNPGVLTLFDRLVMTLALSKVLVTRLSKRWKSFVDHIDFSVVIYGSSATKLVNDIVWNSIRPCDVSVSILPVSVTIMHDFIVDGTLYRLQFS